MNTTVLILTGILFIVGILGTILPALPGPVLIYGGMLLYGYMTDFATLSLYFFIIQAIAMLIIFAIDYISSAVGTKLSGGSKQAAVGAILGTVLTPIFLGPLGIVIGPLLGAITVELIRGVEFKKAIYIGFGTMIGTLGGVLFKLFVVIAMIVYFFIKVL